MIQKAYDVFLTTLANMNRLRIINVLRESDLHVNEITLKTGLNQTTVSHNLKRLLVCGFVDVKKKGKHRFYKLNKKTIKPLMNIIDKHIKKHCSEVLHKSRGE